MAIFRATNMTLGDRVREASKVVGGLNSLADKIGMPRRTLGDQISGKFEVKLSFITAVSTATGCSLDWLAIGRGEMFPEALKTAPSKDRMLPPVSDDDDDKAVIRLPRYDVRASAGRGLIPISDMPIGEVAFARAFLRRLGGNPDYCYALEASGDSMWPTIDDGDLMIADGSQTEIDDGRIYHFNAGERVLVKRARWVMDGRLRLTSDNTAAGYPDEIIAADTAEDFRAGGRIIFSGGSPPPVR